MTTYVRAIETWGARVVPLIHGEPEAVTLDKLSKVNGVMLPGGNRDYRDMAELVFKYVVDQNKAGNFYPMFGVC